MPRRRPASGCRRSADHDVTSGGGDSAMNLKQPAVGLVSTFLVSALSLAFISLFDFPAFVTWVSFYLMCVVTVLIVMLALWQTERPRFAAANPQPMKGILTTLVAMAGGAMVCALFFFIVGQGDQSAGAHADGVHRRLGGHDFHRVHPVGRLAGERAGEGADCCRHPAAVHRLRGELRVLSDVLQLRLHAGRAGVCGVARPAGPVQRRLRAAVLGQRARRDVPDSWASTCGR